jgi:hypothetical protein
VTIAEGPKLEIRQPVRRPVLLEPRI